MEYSYVQITVDNKFSSFSPVNSVVRQWSYMWRFLHGPDLVIIYINIYSTSP